MDLRIPELFEEAWAAAWDRGYQQGLHGHAQEARVAAAVAVHPLGSIEWMTQVGYTVGYTVGEAKRGTGQEG